MQSKDQRGMERATGLPALCIEKNPVWMTKVAADDENWPGWRICNEAIVLGCNY
jgi:hypothetical protein